MNTDHLIRALVADSSTPVASVERRLVLSLAAGLIVAVAIFSAALGLRPGLMSRLGDPRLLLKFIANLALAASAAPLLLRLIRPGDSARALTTALAATPLLLLIGVLGELIATPEASWGTRLIGSNAPYCIICVPLLSAPLLAGTLIALRHGAATNPPLTGAIAGLFSGGLGAAIYAAHCPDDSPLFLAAWYSLAIGLVTIIGSLVGRKVLRW